MFRFLLALTVVAIVTLPQQAGAKSTFFNRGPIEIQHLDAGVFGGSAPKTDADFAKLQRIGVRRLLDVRYPRLIGLKERRLATKYGMTYERIPTGFFPTRKGTVPEILARLKSDCGGTIYIHCNLGSDRLGMLIAIYRVEELGWQPSAAMATWKADQFNPKLKDLDRYFWQRVRCPR